MKRPSSFEEVVHVTNADEIKPISCAEALRSRGVKYRLFTPALLITHGGFDRDPVQEFDALFNLPADHKPFMVQLQRDNEKFFDGLGVIPMPGRSRPVNWDQRLYAIEETYSEDCFAFLGGIAWSNPKTKLFASVMSYDVLVPDPTDKKGEFLSVKVFGVLGNTFIAYLEERLGTTPLARCVPFTGGVLPASVPRTNLLGTTPTDDPLKLREDD